MLQGLTEITDTAESDPDNDASDILILTFDVVSAYLRCLVDNQIIKVNFDDLETDLINFEIRYDLQGPVLAPDLILKPQATQATADDLPQWRDYVARDIKVYTNDWLQAYFESVAWQHKTTPISSDLLTFMVTTLTDKAYDNYRKTPKSWTKKAITGVLTGFFVSNADLTEAELQQVAPALTGFLEFVAEQGWLNAKRASDYQRFINAAALEMLTRAQDPQSAGPGKLIGAEMQKQGIDISDRDAVAKFIDQVNANGGIDSLYEDNQVFADDDDEAPDDLTTLLNHPDQLASVAKLYDPDINQQYLKDAHHPVSAGWRQAKAIETHTLAVETGLRLWIQRKAYAISIAWEAADLLAAVADFMDVLYAQNLVTPEQWSVSAFKEIGQWFRETQSDIDYRDMQPVVAGISDILHQTGVLTKKQAGQLPAAFNGDEIPVIDKPKKVTGKVMSMKQARKLLKNKKRRC